MSQSENTAPRRGQAPDETGVDDAAVLEETPVPAARHAEDFATEDVADSVAGESVVGESVVADAGVDEATEQATRSGRGLRVGVALALATLTLGSATAMAVRGSAPDLAAVAADSPSAQTITPAARATDQVNRSTRRSALPSVSTLPSQSPTTTASASAKVTPKPVAKAPATVKTPAKAVATTPAYPTVLWKMRGTRYATSHLKIRSTPTENATVVTVVAPGAALKATEAVHGSYRQVNWNGRVAWVSKAYLALEKPVVKTSSAVAGSGSSGSGSSGSGSTSGSSGSGSSDVSGSCSKSMPAGVISSGRAAALEACKRFPAITSFGGYRAGDSGEHGSGHAVDMMISGSAGWAVATWARANAGRLGITEVIYQQKIWTTQRSGDGWRSMSDRGSATANHYDHVHITLA